MKFVAIIKRSGNGYSAYLPDLPGCVAAGATFDETEALIRQGAGYHVEMMEEHGESIPDPTTVAIEVEVEPVMVDKEAALRFGG